MAKKATTEDQKITLMRGESPLILTGTQKEFSDWTKPWRYRYWQGGFGAAKSTTLCAGVIELSLLLPKNRWLIGRKNFTDLKDSTMKTFFQMCPQPIIKNWNKTDHEVTLINDSVILFKGCEDYEQFRSFELGGFAIDEANQLDENLFLLLTSRIVGRVPGVPVHLSFGLLASNPPTTDHWLHRMFVKNEDQMFKLFISSSRDNPHLSPDYVKNLERVYAHDPAMIDVLIEGKFGFAMGGKRVYPEFNHVIHTGDFQPIGGKTVFRTWDFGYNHPAVLWSQFDNNDRLIHLYEDLGRDTTISRYADHILTRSNILFPDAHIIDYCDDAGNQRSDKTEESSVSILRTKGIWPRFRRFHFIEARDIVGKRLTTLIDGKPGQMASNACQKLIEGYKGGFRFPETQDGKAEKEYPLQDGYYEHLNDCDLILNANLHLGSRRKKDFKQPNMGKTYGSSRAWG